jgi:hypothetical protein
VGRSLEPPTGGGEETSLHLFLATRRVAPRTPSQKNCIVSCLKNETISLQQDKIITRRNPRLAVRFLRLPPPSTHIADLEDVMFLEADLVRVVGVGFVAVYRLGAVWVLNTLSIRTPSTANTSTTEACVCTSHLFLLGRSVEAARSGEVAAELRLAIAALGTRWAAGIAADGAAGFEAVELRGGVHLWLLLGDCGLRAVGVAVGDWARGAAAGCLFVQRVAVDERPVAGGGLRAVVEDPYDLA